ncbi:aminoglycoside phosphotransferase family protein [Pendulispora rubella]|uniref:Aminoglycoside phosphotransferase family protein n=1 Tax=Pendulispora rubella TaxID=2741070 RepID=A0ABZ2LBJ6_9BACT
MTKSAMRQGMPYGVPPDLVPLNLGRGEQVRAWLERLPAIIASCVEEWHLQLRPCFSPLSYNYAAPAILAGGQRAVLKIGYPNRELGSEAAALAAFDGRGIVRLLDWKPEYGAMLLEQLLPGTALTRVTSAAEVDDARATSWAAHVMRTLWREAPADTSPFATVAQWFEGFERARHGHGFGQLPSALVDRAEQLYRELLASAGPPELLHGDLHHGNILAAGEGSWMAIDPKGLLGERAFDTVALLGNPMPDIADWPDLPRILRRRMAQLSEEAGLDRARVEAWALAQTVLSSLDALEDGDDEGHATAATVATALMP